MIANPRTAAIEERVRGSFAVILNAIIPDEWVMRAMASILAHGAHTYQPGKVHVTCKLRNGGAFTTQELARRMLRSLHESQFVWIVPTRFNRDTGYLPDMAYGATELMRHKLDMRGIEYWRATVQLTRECYVGSQSKYTWGVIVRLQDACDAARAIWPDWLDALRDQRYSNDDH